MMTFVEMMKDFKFKVNYAAGMNYLWEGIKTSLRGRLSGDFFTDWAAEISAKHYAELAAPLLNLTQDEAWRVIDRTAEVRVQEGRTHLDGVA